MTPENFCYWLQGFLELSEKANMSPQQVKAVREHLALVMRKVTPPVRESGVDSLAKRLRAIEPAVLGGGKLC